MRNYTLKIKRYIATPRISKFRIFAWVSSNTNPDDGIYIFASEGDYFFGILHSKVHEIWALKQGTSLEDRPRYTPTTTFETFPFPWPPGAEPCEGSQPSQGWQQVQAIAAHAKALDEFRTGWLNSIEGQVGVTVTEKTARRYTLTNLYNALGLYREEVQGQAARSAPVGGREIWRHHLT